MVGLLLVAGAAVAAFVTAELCPDLLVAAGGLTQAGLLGRDLGHEASRLAACPVPGRR
jgi:hypothetical protein